MSRKKIKTPKRVDLTPQQMEELCQRLEERRLEEADWELIKGLAQTISFLSQALEEKSLSIKRLLNMVFGAGTESKKNILSEPEEEEKKDLPVENPDDTSEDDPDGKSGEPNDDKGPKGHGRNGADAYQGAKKISISHSTLKSGDLCPECKKGKVYRTKIPGIIVRVVGGAPVEARIYELEKLRCNLCGEIFTAKAPEDIGDKKYDETTGAIISLLKYGNGLPFHRLEGLQQSLGIPLPASTQWDIVEKVADQIHPVYHELIRQAAQGDIIHNDDTTMKVLALMKNKGYGEDAHRSGMFTTGVVSIKEGQKIALFFTGGKHAGENMEDLLKKRHPHLDPPIQMCDALSRNLPKALRTILANCLSHGRRKFVDLVSNFPQECVYVIEILAKVYYNDKIAKEKNMTAQQRLEFHQKESGPLMENLKSWLTKQIEEKRVEPNSSMGKAILYMLKHWEPLTLFLRVPKAPLDNNICERALKRSILHRKNSLFFKTQHGAFIGDLFMSLIHTCNLAKGNPFDYLTVLQKYSANLRSEPQRWMPWNYKDTISSMAQ
jgi:transposase